MFLVNSWRYDIEELRLISEGGASLVYFAILLVLIRYARRRPDMELRTAFFLLGSFLFLCGLSHSLIVIPQFGLRYVQLGVLELVAALVLSATCVASLRLWPSGANVSSESCLSEPRRPRSGNVEWPEEPSRAERDLSRKDLAMREIAGDLVAALEAGGVVVWRENLATGLVSMSRGGREIFGFDPAEDLSAAKLNARIHGDDLPSVFSAARAASVDGGLDGKAYRVIRPDGSVRHVVSSGRGEWDKTDARRRELTAIVGVLRDVTRETEMAAELERERARSAHSSKIAGIGRLASGVFHEISNPLLIMRGAGGRLIQLARAVAGDQAEVERCAQLLEQSGDQISTILQGLRMVTREESSDSPSLQNVSRLLEQVGGLFRGDLETRGVTFSIDHGVDARTQVTCRPGEIYQIIINLLANAADAVADVDDPRIVLKTRRSADFVYVSCRDNGPGVSANSAERLFEPFFTTKPAGAGTGLGLSISRGLARAHGGDLVYFREDIETVFELRLPVS